MQNSDWKQLSEIKINKQERNLRKTFQSMTHITLKMCNSLLGEKLKTELCETSFCKTQGNTSESWLVCFLFFLFQIR